LTRPGEDESCEAGFRKCGSGDIDSVICVEVNEPCPINGIQILSLPEAVPAGYTSRTLSTKQIVFTTQDTTLPYARSELAEKGVCLNKEIHSVTSGRDLYPLIIKEDYKTCPKDNDVQFDKRYREIFSTSEEELFKTNRVDGLINQLPKFSEYYYPFSFSWKLSITNYYPYSLDCETNLFSRSQFYEDT